VHERKNSRPVSYRSAVLNAFYGSSRRLFGSDRTGGASALASAAVDAAIGINDRYAVLNGDSTNRASALAGAAANTTIRNLVCHNKLSFVSRAKNKFMRSTLLHGFSPPLRKSCPSGP